jgi:hypothetical protein
MSRSTLLGFFLSAVFALPLCAQVNVLTYHNDNMRSGQNLNEVILTPKNVATGFGKLFTVAVDDWVESQPLFVSNLSIGDGTHNVVFVTTVNNSVYALDADTGAIYWQKNYGVPTPFSGLCTDSNFQKSVHGGAGIISTPVIDLNRGTIYFVTKTGDGGAGGPYALTFYGVNIQTGATVASSPIVPPASDWQPYIQMSRPGMAEDPSGSAIYVALSSTGCKVLQFEHGYIMAFNATTGAQELSFATSVGNSNNGGVWQGGGGLAMDVSGNVFFETADGPYDGRSNFGDSIVQLSSAANGLTLLDWFTPDNQSSLYAEDLDLSSTGPFLLPDQTTGPAHLLVGTGKTEEVFVVNRDVGDMGRITKGKNNIVQDIKRPAYLSGCIDKNLGGAQGDTCRNGAGAYFNNTYLYFSDDANSNVSSPNFVCDVLAYTLTAGVVSANPTARANFGSNCSVGSPIVSANGTTNALVWTVVLKGAATSLRALHANNLIQVYSSQTNATRDGLGLAPHFTTPMVANGKVYVGGKTTTGGDLVVYGVLPSAKE